MGIGLDFPGNLLTWEGRDHIKPASGPPIRSMTQRSFYLTTIEKFINQKIPVEWAVDDLFLPEIKPTAEERRRYAEERRQRLLPQLQALPQILREERDVRARDIT